METPLRSLSEAYNAALAIQAIEEKHVAGQAIANYTGSELSSAAIKVHLSLLNSSLKFKRSLSLL